MTDKWDLDPQSIEGMIARPYYVLGYWKPRKGAPLDTRQVEEGLVSFIRDKYGRIEATKRQEKSQSRKGGEQELLSFYAEKEELHDC